MIPFSILDLSPIREGHDAAHALHSTRDLARHAEQWGYHRFWVAEHHNMPGIASAATSIVIAYVAGGTSSIRVGAGGIMLPNHAPLVIAEQFGTLETLFPGRIDLGLGRAPGTDPLTARALRRSQTNDPEEFPQDVLELMSYFKRPQPGQLIRAVPGAGLNVPVWILGSSLYGAQLAATLGLPYAFASHFAPPQMMDAIALYRRLFKPSEHLAEPYVMLGVNVFAADSDEEARALASSAQQSFLNLRRGEPQPLPPPQPGFLDTLTTAEREELNRVLSASVVGSPDAVRRGLDAFIARTAADELMIAAHVYDHAARLRSFELTAQVRDELAVVNR
jgi:luciferase family oxidoreductase group 1